MNEITITRTTAPKEKPDVNSLGFGRLFTDHMFLIDYNEGTGWHDARIVPYAPLELDPSTCCLHYGQLVFEGLKAYRAANGKTVLFRPEMNMKRLNRSGARLCIPEIDVDFMVKAIAKLVEVDEEWIPRADGTSLYIRPFIIATDKMLGVHPSQSYRLIVICSPSGSYYTGGLAPVRIWVEDEYVRSVPGGTGFTKCAGNYAGSLAGQVKAEKAGFAQVLWLDGKEKKYVDEVGAMNIFFVVDGKVLTPGLETGTILAGITRDSIIALLKSWGVPVEERMIEIQELADAYKAGKLTEVFGAGTAAVVSPVGELKWKDTDMAIGGGKIGELTQKLYDNLTGIQLCKQDDPFGWVYTVQ